MFSKPAFSHTNTELKHSIDQTIGILIQTCHSMETQVSKVDSDSVLNGLHGKKEKEMAIIECKGR